jgi:TRAP-type mannitol/chloroaromatic compound transport system substrate-binding protein
MQDVSKFYSLGSFHQSQEMFEITFNKKKFDSLSKQHQNILRIAAEAANTDNYWYALKRYSDDLNKLITESGVKPFATPKDILAEQIKSWDKVIADFSSKDALFKKIVDSQKAYAKSVMKYLLLNQPDYSIAYKNTFGNPANVKV